MQTVRAIYINGVFRPTQPVDLPEKAEVEFEPRSVAAATSSASPGRDAANEVLEVLSRRFTSGQHDGAARHNEHQP